MSRVSKETLEKCFIGVRVQHRPAIDVANELGIRYQQYVAKWADRFEHHYPERAKFLLEGGVPAEPAPKSFLDRLRAEAADDAIPGFEDATDDEKETAKEEAGDNADPADLLAFVRTMLSDVRRKAENAHDDEVAARFVDQAGKFAALIHRMQKLEQAKEGLIIMSRADVEQAMKDIEAKAAEVDEREDHKRCVDCGRKFRERRGKGES